ncbi:hypothetical protein HYH03_015610 [Edaphochlamys debaryana]|uniref:SRCR domain-containing protein n=1 Tax=Edaphochlamys debaryana TaxID=47281 RepID=A0A836BSD6_9CHLO|nr:hypothetical protein HYH03_015610 [Edaphochlamys debaryana]|eukprot:KAG2485638.1 hypothetical protein HYH03_015610 [Edaphochlamys debaryana]
MRAPHSPARLALVFLLGVGVIAVATASDLTENEPPEFAGPPALPIRIADGRSNTSGILQVWDEASEAWGSVCIRPSAFRQSEEFWSELAVLACRQMGLASQMSVLVNPMSTRYPWRTHKIANALPAKVMVKYYMSGCSNAGSAQSMFDCGDQLDVLENTQPDCSTAAQELGIGQVWMPVAIACRGAPKLRSPPPAPPTSPPPPPLRQMTYSFRLVDPVSGKSEDNNGTKIQQGRLEVLLPKDGSSLPVWGTVCYNPDKPALPGFVLRHICRSMGVPSFYPWVWQGAAAGSTYPPAPDSVPVHWIAAAGCTSDAIKGTLGCTFTPNVAEALALVEEHKSYWDPLQPYFSSADVLLNLAQSCAKGGHAMDACLSCYGARGRGTVHRPAHLARPGPGPTLLRAWASSHFSPTPAGPLPRGESTSPPEAPAPAEEIRNDVELEYDTIFDGALYTVNFNTRAPGPPPTDPTFRGTVCALEDWTGSEHYGSQRALAHTLCRQITDGKRPFGIWMDSHGSFPGLSDTVLSEWPVVLQSLDCSRSGGPVGTADLVAVRGDSTYRGVEFMSIPNNISFCQATVVDPIPSSVVDACGGYWFSQARSALSCRTQDYLSISSYNMMSVRLTGGDAEGTWGRVEVLYRLPGRGPVWGTVCPAALQRRHVQAICRDLGLGWEGAALWPSSRVSGAPAPWRMDRVSCSGPYDPRLYLGQTPLLSLLRDCNSASNTPLSLCPTDEDAVIFCGGAGATPTPSPAYGSSPPPVYGPYGGSPPVYGPYGTY